MRELLVVQRDWSDGSDDRWLSLDGLNDWLGADLFVLSDRDGHVDMRSGSIAQARPIAGCLRRGERDRVGMSLEGFDAGPSEHAQEAGRTESGRSRTSLPRSKLCTDEIHGLNRFYDLATGLGQCVAGPRTANR